MYMYMNYIIKDALQLKISAKEYHSREVKSQKSQTCDFLFNLHSTSWSRS